MGGIGTHLEDLDYLGLGTVVRRGHPEIDVDLTYIKQSGEGTGDAGDQYTGLDRFGRVEDQRWLDTGTGSHTDRFGYGYDRDGNRLYRENLVDATFSELYHADGSGNGYDALNQLTAFARGTLNAGKDSISGTASRTQEWDFDALGNWDSVTTDGSTQTRSHDAQNQITSISGATTPGYDSNGNTTTDESGNTLVYDAWNRLVEVNDGSNPLVEYSHDALNRRVTEDPGTARELFYSLDWQVVEERESGVAVVQQVWSPVYVDALVLRDRDADANSGNGLEERLYAQQDANYNVTAVLDLAGAVVERFAYDPFGAVTVLAGDFSARAGSNYAWVYQHQGGRYQVETGLYHFRRREFSPSLGRWVQLDPIGFDAGDAILYRYVGNNPVGLVDPMGLEPVGKLSDLVYHNANLNPALRKTIKKEDLSGHIGKPLAIEASVEFSVPKSESQGYQFSYLLIVQDAKSGAFVTGNLHETFLKPGGAVKKPTNVAALFPPKELKEGEYKVTAMILFHDPKKGIKPKPKRNKDIPEWLDKFTASEVLDVKRDRFEVKKKDC
jgi:RHS repeat-associated protein